jgi:hypothetical protein
MVVLNSPCWETHKNAIKEKKKEKEVPRTAYLI